MLFEEQKHSLYLNLLKFGSTHIYTRYFINTLYVKYSYTLYIKYFMHWETQLWSDFGVLNLWDQILASFPTRTFCVYLCVCMQVTSPWRNPISSSIK